jgi:hypothetical protein
MAFWQRPSRPSHPKIPPHPPPPIPDLSFLFASLQRSNFFSILPIQNPETQANHPITKMMQRTIPILPGCLPFIGLIFCKQSVSFQRR